MHAQFICVSYQKIGIILVVYLNINLHCTVICSLFCNAVHIYLVIIHFTYTILRSFMLLNLIKIS